MCMYGKNRIGTHNTPYAMSVLVLFIELLSSISIRLKAVCRVCVVLTNCNVVIREPTIR